MIDNSLPPSPSFASVPISISPTSFHSSSPSLSTCSNLGKKIVSKQERVHRGLAIKSHETIREKGVFTKTRLCAYFSKGKCVHGNLCQYAHCSDEVRRKPDLIKTTLCESNARNACPLPASECKYAHGMRDLRSTEEIFKTSLCRFWVAGNCTLGDACRHAHGELELRGDSLSTPSPSPSPAPMTNEQIFSSPRSIEKAISEQLRIWQRHMLSRNSMMSDDHSAETANNLKIEENVEVITSLLAKISLSNKNDQSSLPMSLAFEDKRNKMLFPVASPTSSSSSVITTASSSRRGGSNKHQ